MWSSARRAAEGGLAALALVGTALFAPADEPTALPTTWRLEGGVLRASAGASASPQAVGSLQKPFVARAWALAHPETPTPRFLCEGGATCWLPRGHGTLGLPGALALSCNAYFRRLADQVPPEQLRATFLEAGFLVVGIVTPDAAIGLDRGEGTITISARALLEAFSGMTREPWGVGESVRSEILAGLRASAHQGTAKGLGRPGYWAKTGTVELPARRKLATAGWALAVDDAGSASLLRLESGTGRDAAVALGRVLGDASPMVVFRPRDARGRVRVRLLEAFHPHALRVRNAGSGPVPGRGGFVGPGASLDLLPADTLGESLWDLRLERSGLVRRIAGTLEVRRGPGGSLTVTSEMDSREYVAGVVAAESPPDRERRIALGAAALRFLARGPRHPGADVCDTTHCAWFIARGPRVFWPSRERVVLDDAPLAPLDEETWGRIEAAAERPGAEQWTSHCGGRPLSPHAVWGSGDRRETPCPLHAPGSVAPWRRLWSDRDLERAFGSSVSSLAVVWSDDVWTLEIKTAHDVHRLLYDDAHRELARVMGWNALPSPADAIARVSGGFRAEGVGLGHRVGLCLGSSNLSSSLRPDR